jgi:hypothetical protein
VVLLHVSSSPSTLDGSLNKFSIYLVLRLEVVSLTSTRFAMQRRRGKNRDTAAAAADAAREEKNKKLRIEFDPNEDDL